VTDYLAVAAISCQWRPFTGYFRNRAAGWLHKPANRCHRKLLSPLVASPKKPVAGANGEHAADTYVGNSAGSQILAGQIRRGDTTAIHAADLAIGYARFHRLARSPAAADAG